MTSWTVAHQAPLSMGFSRQEYWSGLPCPPPGDLPDPGIETQSLMSPALAGRFFTTSVTREASVCVCVCAHIFGCAGCLVAACGIYFPDQGSNLGRLHWELQVLATGPPGKSPVSSNSAPMLGTTTLIFHIPGTRWLLSCFQVFILS